MRRKPDRVRARQVPPRKLGPPGFLWAALLMRGARPPLRIAKSMRRLLVVGGLLICGWLLGSPQSAHAADVAPPPAMSNAADGIRAITTHGAATRTRDHDVSTAGAPGRPHRRHADRADRADRGERADRTAHPMFTRPADAVATRSSAPLARTQSDKAVRDILTGTRQAVHQIPAAAEPISRGPQAHARPATRSAGSAVLGQTQAFAKLPALHAPLEPGPAAASHGAAVPAPLPVFAELSQAPSPATHAIGALPDLVTGPFRGTSGLGPPPFFGAGIPGLVTHAVSSVIGSLHGTTALDPATALRDTTGLDPHLAFAAPAGVPGAAPALVTGLTGHPLPLVGGIVALPGSGTDVIGSGPGIIQRPYDAIGAVAALVSGPAGVLTGPLGALVPTALGTKALDALTAPLKSVLRQLGRLTTHLLAQVAGLLEPIARLLGPIDRLGLTGALADATPLGSVLPPAGLATACAPPGPSPPGGPWPATAVPAGSGQIAAGGSVEQLTAYPPAAPAAQPLGVGPYAVTSDFLCGQWPQPPRSPDVAHAYLSGQSTDPFSPGDSNVPLSGTSNRALSGSSHNDGGGDTPHSWQARVPEAFVPAGFVAPPAISTAADEPAFSPD
ncbi:MAG TPA: hypothetical protein VE465_03630 [Streptosporangiaceae bacterium]|nr:hypothetical protein [Streptosporangiaceae bacterium]